MAERRMFSQKIVESDAFYDMPADSQALYVHLCMNADDDGFVNNPQKIRRAMGASEDSLKILLAKRYILPFENGIMVVKHWRMQNSLRKDRYKPTEYSDEKGLLYLKPNGSYTFDENQGVPLLSVKLDEPLEGMMEAEEITTNNDGVMHKNGLATKWQPNGNQMATVGCRSIDKYNKVVNNNINTTHARARECDVQISVDKFEQLAECEGWEKYPNGDVYLEVRDAAFKLIDAGEMEIGDISNELICQVLESLYCGRERRSIVDLPKYILAIVKRLRKQRDVK